MAYSIWQDPGGRKPVPNQKIDQRQMPASLLCDFYKTSHRPQYPKKTAVVYSTWTPRSNRYFPQADAVVVFAIQAFVKEYLMDYFNKNFFDRPREEVVAEYVRYMKYALFIEEPEWQHIADLHDLGYLPIHIKALDEGTLCPIRVPMMVIYNTDERFFWVTNYLETLISTELWQAQTSATIAYEYKKVLDKFAIETSSDPGFTMFQGHDFSMRGMGGLFAGMSSGGGHLLSFYGTDTIPAIFFLEKYYNANIEKEMVGTSIAATEHSVMSAGGVENEFETYLRLITKVYPTGPLSIVSDTWDLFWCINNIIGKLKDAIMERDGKVVVRPDSGDPVKIICGDPESDDPDVAIGVVELLWNIFGGTVNDKGYKELDPHIGSIYGDSITLERAEEICQRLKDKGFASTNVVFGIGSFTYQLRTRDSFGFAIKSCMCVVDGEEKMIYKDPKTDDGMKKSQKGCVAVVEGKDGLEYIDELPLNHGIKEDQLKTVFLNSVLYSDVTLAEVRMKLAA